MGSKRLIAVPYYGGKQQHLAYILPLLPSSLHYCEPFGGGASVLLNKPPVPIETYNDLDGEVVNFFKTLRDRTEDLLKALHLTPYSRAEFAAACYETPADELERARLFFVRMRQGMMARPNPSPGTWSFCKLTTKRGISGSVSRYLAGIEPLEDVVARFQRVQLENRPAVDVIKSCDSPETLFYVDPPYVLSSRTTGKQYVHEMTDDQHRELAGVLNGIRGRAAVSGYRCDLTDELYAGWDRVDLPARACASSKGVRMESIWMNY